MDEENMKVEQGGEEEIKEIKKAEQPRWSQ